MQKSFMIGCAVGMLIFGMTVAQAQPGMGADIEAKFIKIDSNADGNISTDEFSNAYPKMTDKVFGIIDKDSNSAISMEEWKNFQTDHMRGMQQEEQEAKSHDESSKGRPMRIDPPAQ